MKLWISLIAVLLGITSGALLLARTSPGRPQFPTRCSAIAPTTISDHPVQWLGACVAGKADGIGILRVGSHAPFAFLVGHMKAGRPASGLVFRTSGDYQQAMGFDKRGETIPADGEHLKEQDQVWADAVRAARSVADRFAAVGNRASAAYYRNFAHEIEDGRPE